MNNTSRFKFYGILAAALIVVAGVVWFYHAKERSGKARSTRTVVTTNQTKQTNRLPQQPVASLTQQPETDDVQKPPTVVLGTTLAHATGMDIPVDEQRKMALTPDQEKQLKAPLNAIKNDVMEMLAGNASYQQTNDCTIVINTRLSQEQSDEIEKRLYKEVGDIIGEDKMQLIDNVLMNGLRGASYAWGTVEMQFSVIGANKYNVSTDKQTEEPLKAAEAFRVKFNFSLVDGVNFGGTYLCMSKDSFIEEYGALAVTTLQMTNGEGK